MSEDLSRNGAFLDLRDHAAFATTKRADQHLDSKNAAQQGGPVVTAALGELQRRLEHDQAPPGVVRSKHPM
jgi:hypothetical protein